MRLVGVCSAVCYSLPEKRHLVLCMTRTPTPTLPAVTSIPWPDHALAAAAGQRAQPPFRSSVGYHAGWTAWEAGAALWSRRIFHVPRTG